MSDLMQEHRVEVDVQGDLVVLRIGNNEIKMAYEHAFMIADWLDIRAKQAKIFAGDYRQRLRVRGNLSDANADELRAQELRSAGAQFLPKKDRNSLIGVAANLSDGNDNK